MLRPATGSEKKNVFSEDPEDVSSMSEVVQTESTECAQVTFSEVTPVKAAVSLQNPDRNIRLRSKWGERRDLGCNLLRLLRRRGGGRAQLGHLGGLLVPSLRGLLQLRHHLQ